MRRGPYMLRYATEDDFGLPKTAFNFCTFWLIEALHIMGRRRGSARALRGDAVAAHRLRPAVGRHRPRDRRALGQFPADLLAGGTRQLRLAPQPAVERDEMKERSVHADCAFGSCCIYRFWVSVLVIAHDGGHPALQNASGAMVAHRCRVPVPARLHFCCWDPCGGHLQTGDQARLESILEGVAADDRVFAVGLCDDEGRCRVRRTSCRPTSPAKTWRARKARASPASGMTAGAFSSRPFPSTCDGEISYLAVLHDLSYIDERSGQLQTYVIAYSLRLRAPHRRSGAFLVFYLGAAVGRLAEEGRRGHPARPQGDRLATGWLRDRAADRTAVQGTRGCPSQGRNSRR